jgi:Transcriptional regulators
MEYRELARQLLLHMSKLRRFGENRKINDSMQGETFMLSLISFHGGDIQPGEISRHMGISAARITAALNNLEKKGFITRRIDPENRRHILIELTEYGKEQARLNYETVVDKTCDILSNLNEDDASELVRIIGKLAEKMPECGIQPSAPRHI